MATPGRAFLAVILLLPLLALFACGDDDPTDPGGGTDTTAPQSVGTDPSSNDNGVGVNEEIRVTFSEAMKTSSATGNVTLSAGSVTDLTWENGDRTLVIEHTAWPEGTQVMVTIGTGLEDAAGNSLGSDFVFSFWTDTSQLQVLAMDPADGSVGVDRNALVSLLFSRGMNLFSLESAVTISDVLKTDYPFEIVGDEENWVTFAITGPLPASTAITVSVSTLAQDEFGGFLPAARSFGFTTGVEIDDTPPTLVAAVPPSGSTVDADIGFLKLIFSEPIDPNSLEPSRINVEFFLLVDQAGEAVWNDDYTEITVPLPVPLPPGTPMEVTFDSLTDRNGVVQTTPFTWEAVSTGQANYFPVVDGARYTYFEHSTEGTIGNPTPMFEQSYLFFVQFETQAGDTFRWAEYDDDSYTTGTDWDIYERTSSELLWAGIHELDEGVPSDLTITPPVRMVQLPPRAGSWRTDAIANQDGDIFDIDWAGETVGQEDVVLPALLFTKRQEPEIFWKDAWRVELVFSAGVEGADFFQATRTMWFAANLGLVQVESLEEDLDENTWDQTETYMLPDIQD